MKDILALIFRRSKNYGTFTYKQRFRLGLFICFLLVPLLSLTGALIYVQLKLEAYIDCYEDKDKDGFGANDVSAVLMRKSCNKGYVQNNTDADDYNFNCEKSTDEACKVYNLSMDPLEVDINNCMCVDGGVIVGCKVKNSGKFADLEGVLVTFYPDSTDLSKSKKELISLNAGEAKTVYFPKITAEDLKPGYYLSKIKVTHINVTEDKSDDYAVFPMQMFKCKEYLLAELIEEKDTLLVQYVVDGIEEQPCTKNLYQKTNKLSLRSSSNSVFIGKLKGGNLSEIKFADVNDLQEMEYLKQEQEKKAAEKEERLKKEAAEKEHLKEQQREREQREKERLAEKQRAIEAEEQRLIHLKEEEQKQKAAALLAKEQQALEEEKRRLEEKRRENEQEERRQLELEQETRREGVRQQTTILYTAPDVCYRAAFNYRGEKYPIESVSGKQSKEIENLVKEIQTEITKIKNGGMGGRKKKNENLLKERNSWINQYCKVLRDRSLTKY